jgi:hypothetical protein
MLGVLGLPWSVPVYFVESNEVAAPMVVAAAVVNVLLVGWLCGQRAKPTTSQERP